MTGQEAIGIVSGDFLGLAKNLEINGYTWKPVDLLQVEYVEIKAGGHFDWWVRNLSWKEKGVTPSVQSFSMYTMLNYVYKVTGRTLDKMNRTTIEHKFKLGDTAWIMEHNKPSGQKIVDIKIVMHTVLSSSGKKDLEPHVSYHRCGEDYDKWYGESELYTSKEELLDSLR